MYKNILHTLPPLLAHNLYGPRIQYGGQEIALDPTNRVDSDFPSYARTYECV